MSSTQFNLAEFASQYHDNRADQIEALFTANTIKNNWSMIEAVLVPVRPGAALKVMALVCIAYLTILSQLAHGDDSSTTACLEPPLERFGTAIEEPAHHFNLSPDCVVQVPGEPGTDEENRHLGVGLCFPELIRCDEADNHYYRLHISNQHAPETFAGTRSIFSLTHDEYLSTADYEVFISSPSTRARRETTQYIYLPRHTKDIFIICIDIALICTLRGQINNTGVSYSLHSNNMAFRDWLQLHESVITFIEAAIEDNENPE